jgi:hypothetical protein
MKNLKLLGAVAVVGTGLMALVGAGCVSATVLCKEPGVGGGANPTGTVCPANQAYPSKTSVHAVNKGTVKLDTNYKTIECTGSTVGGETSNEGSSTETVTGPEGTLTFTGCNCPTVKVIKAGTLEVHWISGTHNGTLTSSGARVTTICKAPVFGFNVHCNYVTVNTHIGTVVGGNPAVLTTSENIPVEEAESDGLCPDTADFTATYEITTPTPLYVTGHT